MADVQVERIKAAIEARRNQLGLTQSEAAKRAGVSDATWGNVENQRYGPHAKRSEQRVAAALSWPLDAIERLRAGADPDELLAIDLRSPREPATVADIDQIEQRLGALEARMDDLEASLMRPRFAAFERPEEDR